MNQTLIRMPSGEVRKGGQIDGDLLGTMSFWYNVEENRADELKSDLEEYTDGTL